MFRWQKIDRTSPSGANVSGSFSGSDIVPVFSKRFRATCAASQADLLSREQSFAIPTGNWVITSPVRGAPVGYSGEGKECKRDVVSCFKLDQICESPKPSSCLSGF